MTLNAPTEVTFQLGATRGRINHRISGPFRSGAPDTKSLIASWGRLTTTEGCISEPTFPFAEILGAGPGLSLT